MDRVDDFYNELLLGFAMPDRMFWRKFRRADILQREHGSCTQWSDES